MDYKEILKHKMQENDADAKTIGEYLHQLLHTLWNEGEGFDGKRPFGNSGWEYEIYAALVNGGYISGKIDSDGFLDECDTKAGAALVFNLIDFVFSEYR